MVKSEKAANRVMTTITNFIISEHLRHKLRMCIWKYWKKPMTKYKALRKLRISEYNAHMVANTRRGYYWGASTVILHIAISNKSSRM